MHITLKKDNGVALLTIKQPASLNAMNAAMLEEMGRVLARVEADNEVRVLVITGTGRPSLPGGHWPHGGLHYSTGKRVV